MTQYLTRPLLLLWMVVLISPYGPSEAFASSVPVTTTPASPLLLLFARKDDTKDTPTAISRTRSPAAKMSAQPKNDSRAKKSNTDKNKKAHTTNQKPESKSEKTQPFKDSIVLEHVCYAPGILWDVLLDRLVQYKSKHGTFSPRQDIDSQLHRWMWQQRRLFRGGKLKQDRKDKLDAIGFSLDDSIGLEYVSKACDILWDQMLDKLVQ